jgi:hypothetical protein
VNIDWDKLYRAYDWAKEWQTLLAGLLVFFAALVIAWATLRAAKIRSTAKPEAKSRTQPDLRLAPLPISPSAGPPVAASSELLGALEQLRSLIRSALGSLPQSGEKPGDKENSPAYFLCQRILHLRIDQLQPSHAGKDVQDGFSQLLKKLHVLRAHLKKDSSAAELSEILVQINSCARNLVTALTPAAERRRQADTR